MTATFYRNYSLIVILGHYGSGKTNLALNLAFKLRKEGKNPTLVDLDVVNPYFRSTDFEDLAASEDITVLGPVFGNSNLDAPSLAPSISGAIEHASLERPVILDVGGDPDGARSLVRYIPLITCAKNKLVVAVINLRRPETQSLEDNLSMLSSLSGTASLDIDALVGNTHLAEYTMPDTVTDSLPLLKEIATRSGIPLIAVTVPVTLSSSGNNKQLIKEHSALLHEDEMQQTDLFGQEGSIFLPVERLVRTSWQ